MGLIYFSIFTLALCTREGFSKYGNATLLLNDRVSSFYR